MTTIFKKIKVIAEKLYQILLFLLMVGSLIFRFFNSHLIGAFILSLLAYFLWPSFFEIHPYTPTELLNWFVEQSSETKALLATSILTVLGFLIAFQAGTSSARKQMQAQIRLDAAFYIHSIYSDILQQIIKMKIYVDSNIKLIEDIYQHIDEKQLEFAMKFILSKNQSFLDARDKFSVLYNQSMDVFSRYGNVLYATPKTFSTLRKANASLAIILEKMWILTPNTSPDFFGWKDHYLKHADLDKLNSFSYHCEKTHQYVSGMSGLVKGIITAPIDEQNGWAFLNLLKTGFGILELTRMMAKGENISEKFESLFPPYKPPQ